MALASGIDTGPITMRLRALKAQTQMSIMLVDDDELERTLLSDRLESRGFEVTQASDGAAALSLLDQQRTPVLLADWMMPVMSGIELTEQLRGRGEMDTYVIMLTSRDSDIDLERGYLAGVDDYLTKKIRESELLARVHAAFHTFALRCELRQTRAALAAATSALTDKVE